MVVLATMLAVQGISQEFPSPTVTIYSRSYNPVKISTPVAPYQARVTSGQNRFTVAMKSVKALEEVKGFYRVYLDFEDRGGLFDTVIVYCHEASMPIQGGSLKPGQAAILNSYGFEKIADVKVSYDLANSSIVFESPIFANPKVVARMLGAHFLPKSYDESILPDGFGEFSPQYVWRNYSHNHVMMPPTWPQEASGS